MKFFGTRLFILIFILLMGTVGWYLTVRQDGLVEKKPIPPEQESNRQTAEIQTVHFSQLNSSYRFSGEISGKWRAEYVQESEAINIYNPAVDASSNLERSQIFIRNFTADAFLTLSTVTIFKQKPTIVGKHTAVEYEIEKKPSRPPFPNQPSWRSQRHELIDIRFVQTSPSIFFVIARRPDLDPEIFKSFIQKLRFHNDPDNFGPPVDRAGERVLKKPFGIYVSPANSPVSPERFEGYHTGVDFEIFDGEEYKDVSIYALCGGSLKVLREVDGYGGLIVQECLYNDQPVSILYGHIRLASGLRKVGEYIYPGEKIAVLGSGFSPETDSERKHLHLSIQKGYNNDIRGYVPTLNELSLWLDPFQVF